MRAETEVCTPWWGRVFTWYQKKPLKQVRRYETRESQKLLNQQNLVFKRALLCWQGSKLKNVWTFKLISAPKTRDKQKEVNKQIDGREILLNKRIQQSQDELSQRPEQNRLSNKLNLLNKLKLWMMLLSPHRKRKKHPTKLSLISTSSVQIPWKGFRFKSQPWVSKRLSSFHIIPLFTLAPPSLQPLPPLTQHYAAHQKWQAELSRRTI